MIFTLNILFDVAVLAAIYAFYREFTEEKYYLHDYCMRNSVQCRWYFEKLTRPKVKPKEGLLEQAVRKASIAEKFAERAFNLASTANIGIIALQKALAQPRPVTRQQLTQNALASKGVDQLFSGGNGFDWLYPILSDAERDLIDKAKEHSEKFKNEEVT